MSNYGSYQISKHSEFVWEKSFTQLETDLGFNSAFDVGMAETCARFMNPFVPMDSGVLSQTYETGHDAFGGFVKYVSPYAHYQFNGIGFNFSKKYHSLATSHWDKAMMTVYENQLANDLNTLRKRFVK